VCFIHMKTICVFCAATDIDQKYITDALEFSTLLVSHGYSLVWGGSDKGLMKVVADTVQGEGGKIFGITMELLKGTERKNADEMIIAKDLATRKSLMMSRSDALVLMVGGIGSLDEVTEMLELKKHNLHTKPIVVLNTDGFYEGLRSQLVRMKKEGFITKDLSDLIIFADTPKDAITIINTKLAI
jgi:uncharacterized protein (TIGR00730 family)